MIIYDNRKQRKKPKLNANQRILAEEWETILKKHATKPVRPISGKTKIIVTEKPIPKIASLNEWVTGPVYTKPIPKYTGTKMIGIGTMHKSNAVPVFSGEEAADLARMRRG
jgi:hypothetical protein